MLQGELKSYFMEFFISDKCGIKWSEIQGITSQLTLVEVFTYVNDHFLCFYCFKEKESQG
jgi:hypothetical protein